MAALFAVVARKVDTSIVSPPMHDMHDLEAATDDARPRRKQLRTCSGVALGGDVEILGRQCRRAGRARRRRR
jgi:hypothetical protein